MVTRRGQRGSDDERSQVSDRRLPFLQFPDEWPLDFVGFEMRWGTPGETDTTEALARSLEEELQRELAPGHRLHGREPVAIAKRERTDDVLFALAGTDEVAVVHLTWIGRPDTSPWPSTELYANFDAFLAAAPADFG